MWAMAHILTISKANDVTGARSHEEVSKSRLAEAQAYKQG